MNIENELNKLKEQDQLRSLVALPACGGKFVHNGREMLNFSSNDYLDLAADERLKKAAVEAIRKWGCGATGSRLMSGHFDIHAQLEERLAELLGYESALVFGSGFLTNVGVISSLAESRDLIYFDRLNHASLIDGIRLSGARWKRFRHNDVEDLRKLLEKGADAVGRKFIVIDSVFSMDGDIGPLEEIHALAREHQACLIVDEAHAVGIFGPQGAGVCRERGLQPDLVTGTFSKSFGGYGGFAVCSAEIRAWLINKARPFIFSTGLPPASVASSLKGIQILREEPNLGTGLLEKAESFHGFLQRKGFNLLPFQSQIIPVIVGENEKAVRLAEALWDEGLYVKAIRPPTVPKGTARLRLSVTLAHGPEDLRQAAEKLASVSRRLEVL